MDSKTLKLNCLNEPISQKKWIVPIRKNPNKMRKSVNFVIIRIYLYLISNLVFDNFIILFYFGMFPTC